jgi:hypothetical protein
MMYFDNHQLSDFVPETRAHLQECENVGKLDAGRDKVHALARPICGLDENREARENIVQDLIGEL